MVVSKPTRWPRWEADPVPPRSIAHEWTKVPTISPASARVRLPGTSPLMMRMLLARRARVISSSTTGSTGRVGSWRRISSAALISAMSSASEAFHALFGRIGERAKMPFPVHPHMLRHGCGYALANAGHDTRALQAWLGHRNIQHTVRYTELAPDRFKDFWRD